MVTPARHKVQEGSFQHTGPSFCSRRSLAVATLLLTAVALAACESPAAPVSCGPIPQQTINVGESTTVSVCFNDANGDMLSYSATSSNPSVATVAAAGSSVTVTAVSPGNAAITITARDPGGLQATAVVNVTVPNRAPRAVGTVAPLTVVGGETATVDVSGNFMEPDGQSLSYSASSSNASVATASAAGSAVTVTAVGRGMATVTVTATDPGGASATQSFQVTVPNRAPEAVGTIPAATVEAGETSTVDLSSYFTDADGDALSYTASSSATAVATVTVAGSALRVIAGRPGTATVTVTAADPDGETATQSFQVTVPNRGPEAVGTIPAQMLTEGGTRSLVLASYFTDPDGDALTFTTANANPAVAVGTVSGSVLTIRAVGVGFSVITVTATDPGGLTATQIVTVEVTARNRAPQPQGSIPAQSMRAGESTTVNLSSYFTDPDGDALTYTASSANAAVATGTAVGATLTITGRSPGSTTVTVTALDPGDLTATQSVSVTVGTAARPDLLFSGVTPTQVTIAPGGSKSVVFTIRNAGNANSAATRARAHQSPDPRITTSDRVVSDPIAVRALPPNGTRRIELTLNIPSNFTPGSFYVGMCVDPVTGETNTANNCSSAARVTVAVSNQAPQPVGTIPAVSVTAGQTAAVDLTAYFTDPDGDALTYTASSSNPGVATVAVAGSTLTIRGGAQGTATITVVAEDPGGLTAAQAISVTVGTAGAPDLGFIEHGPPREVSINAGSARQVSFEIANTGDANSAPTKARGHRSPDATITTSDAVAGNPLDVGGLAPNERTTIRLPVTVPSNSAPGSFYIGMCVDPVTGETNTGNNCSAAVKLTVIASVTRLTNNAAADFDPAWSPDGSKIAFRSARDGNYEIYTMNGDGSGVARLTNDAAEDEYPAWSPDGSRIAFSSKRAGNYEIYLMNTDGSGLTRLTNDSDWDNQPAWSPDGSKIAFSSFRDGNGEIYVMNADGSAVTRLTNSSSHDHSPAWSADGSIIAFTSNGSIFVMKADGSGAMRVIEAAANNLAWSPDGSRIAFDEIRGGNSHIYSMNADGSSVTELTDTHWNANPAWSPDGTRISFESNRDGNAEIYVMNAPASGATAASPVPSLRRSRTEPDLPVAIVPDPVKRQVPRSTGQIRAILRELPP